MKQLRLIIVLALLAFSSNLKAQPFLVLSSSNPLLCNHVEVTAYAYDGSWGFLDRTISFTVVPGMPATTYDLSQAAYWPSGVPAIPWTIEDIIIRPAAACNLTPSIGSISCTRYNRILLHTGINPCATYAPTECFEYDAVCGGCNASDIVNANLNLIGSNIDVDIY